MKYKLISATEKDINKLISYKLESILESNDEIINYVKETIPKYLNDYKIITINNKIIGCQLIRDYEEGKLLDEIYIEKEYRNKGIGTNIIKNIISLNKLVYLWVYKDNRIAINLYKKLDFKIIDKNNNRYLMKRG